MPGRNSDAILGNEKAGDGEDAVGARALPFDLDARVVHEYLGAYYLLRWNRQVGTHRCCASRTSRAHSRHSRRLITLHTECDNSTNLFSDTSDTSGDGVNEDWWRGIVCGCTEGSRSGSRICSKSSRAKRFARMPPLLDRIECRVVSIFHLAVQRWNFMWKMLQAKKKINQGT